MADYPEVDGLADMMPMDHEKTMGRAAALRNGGCSGNGPAGMEGTNQRYERTNSGETTDIRVNNNLKGQEYLNLVEGLACRVITSLWCAAGQDDPLMEVRAMYSTVAQKMVISFLDGRSDLLRAKLSGPRQGKGQGRSVRTVLYLCASPFQ